MLNKAMAQTKAVQLQNEIEAKFLAEVTESVSRSRGSSLLTIGEAARLLNLHINTIRRWDNQGIIKAHRVGPRRDRRFNRDDIEALVV